jgi:putative hydrolase of the HAD superfamily
MAKINAIFWDVGGVLLSNAWDHDERGEAIAHFRLEADDFERRHASVVSDFETGKLNLEAYLERTVFYCARPFDRDAFRQFMLSRSQPRPEALALARELAGTGRYLMSTINNESADLNEYRITQFALQGIFDLFVSSCFVGLRKPSREIYQLAMNLRQRAPDACCFIDDRPENLKPALELGMHALRMEEAGKLRDELKALGVEFR